MAENSKLLFHQTLLNITPNSLLYSTVSLSSASGTGGAAVVEQDPAAGLPQDHHHHNFSNSSPSSARKKFAASSVEVVGPAPGKRGCCQII